MAQAKRRRKRKIFSPVYLTLVLIVLYLPILMVVIYSFNSGRTIGSWQGFTTDWYSRLFSNALMADALKNSLVLAVVSSLLAGGIGNLIDRVLNGEVVDYINPLFIDFAVFNFADICVCVGVALWVLVILLEEVDDKPSKEC